MAGIETDTPTPHRGSLLWVVAGLVAVAAVVMTSGVVALLVLALVGVLVALAVGVVVAVAGAVRGTLQESGDHPPPGLKASGSPAAQRADAGHFSPSAS